MAENGAWLTQEAFDSLTKELEYLSGPYRQEIVDRIAQARDEGDLRENGGYHAARDEQGKNEARIKQLKHLLETAQVGDAPKDNGVVALGMVIEAQIGARTMKFLLGSREIEETLPAGSDLRVFSEKSPMGAALLGHKEGETVTYAAPNGNEMSAKIISVTPFQG
ncbi:MAG: transcription elongation factor GreA [Rothia sp. (in: high G+C Gram-positive bacteria)]|uniref:transcription elongation factor GreA n=1 Tax=Rothia sp. (in: high G+C Gram-positive bacteria) TaxID=1885016 RepID=UPI0026E008BF|nr:transcription elongation factor GreA [Rothia sp. (in: high G+C Gram-positive bacteria)]MDO5750290.1 transcription elongation factor GreA [Rothia sp. (in: high G+C Gram-positive bacteria)]